MIDTRPPISEWAKASWRATIWRLKRARNRGRAIEHLRALAPWVLDQADPSNKADYDAMENLSTALRLLEGGGS